MTMQGPRLQRVAVIVVMLGLIAGACGNASGTNGTAEPSSTAGGGVRSTTVPGVTGDEIRFSAVGTNSNNPLGTCVLDCYADGIRAYFDYRNSEGGIDGRKLVLSKELDDELSKNQEKALEVITANDTFATFSATELASGWANLADAGIPTYVWAINAAQASGKPQIFGNREVNCVECVRRGDAYVAKLAGAKKVAALGYGVADSSRLCANSASDAIKTYGGNFGAESVYLNDDLAFGLPNGIAPEVTAMKEAGVDLVIGCLDLNGMKTLATELERQGMGDVPLYHLNSYDEQFVSQAGDLFEGDYVQSLFVPFESEGAAASLDTYKEWMAKNGSPLSEIAMVGWINADEAYQGIKAAGPDFDRQKVIDATNQMTDYTADGLVAPIDWSRQHDAPTPDDPATHGSTYECIALVQVRHASFELVGDPAKPWICWPGGTRDWSEPTAMSFS